MKARMNRVRLLAGGLAAITVMSSMPTMAVFAAEDPNAEVRVEITSEDATVYDVAAEDEIEIQGSGKQEMPETVEREDVAISIGVLDVKDVKDVPDVEIPVTTDEADATDAAENTADEAKTSDSEEANVETEDTDSNETTAEAGSEETADKQAEVAEVAEVTEDAAEDVKVADETADQEVKEEEEITVVKTMEMLVKGPKSNIPEDQRQSYLNITTYYSNGEIVRTIRTLDSKGNVIGEEYYRETNGTRQKLETGDMSEVLEYAEADRVAAAEQQLEQEILEELGQAQSIEELIEKANSMADKMKSGESYYGQAVAIYNNGKGLSEGEKQAINFFKGVMDKALSKAMDKLPGNEFYGKALKGFMMDMLGFPSAEENIADLVQTSAERLENKMDQYQGENNRRREIVSSLSNYGSRMDEFSDATSMIASTIKDLQKDVNDGKLTQTQMDIRVAAMVGKINDTKAGGDNIFSKMFNAATTMLSAAGKGPDTDIKNRNLFELFYEYEREESLFSGEAMDKASKAIQSRVNRYVNNCRIVMEALKAHKNVANLTQEQIDALDEDTRSTYTNIKSSAYDIEKYMKKTLRTITGDKTSDNEDENNGIVDRISQYYSKDRLIYIDVDKKEIKEIGLSDKLKTQNSEKFDYKNNEKKSPLTAAQIKKIVEKANSLNMTPLQYLEFVGFDVSELRKSNRNLFLETGSSHGVEGGSCGMGGWKYEYDYYKGYNMKKKNEGEQKNTYYSEEYGSSIWGVEKYTDRNDLLVYFQAK